MIVVLNCLHMPYLKCIESNMRIFVTQLFLNGSNRMLGSVRTNIYCLYVKQKSSYLLKTLQ